MSGAAITGGVLALGGSVLLLFGSFLPLINIGGFGGSVSVTLWDATDRPEEAVIPLLIAIGVNAMYFAFGSVGGRRGWAFLALAINVIVLFNTLLAIERTDISASARVSASTRCFSRAFAW